jgi:hypothetical protein
MAFSTLICAQLLHALSCRANADERNPKLEAVLGGGFALQALALGHPGVRSALGNEPLDPLEILVSLALGFAPHLIHTKGASSS